jgi:NAD(P)H-nitrite reductase large subunit
MNYVIIGNGAAGIHAAEAIRMLDPRGAITMIADEAVTPYCRPMISMVLEGTVSPDRLPIRSDAFYEKLNIRPVLGARVSAMDIPNRRVRVRNEWIDYDRLLIASGADPRPIAAEGLHLDHIFFMRTQEHIRGMLSALPGAKRALVLGGGLVGFKAAYGMLRRGLEVTMLIRSGYPLSLQVDQTAGHLIQNALSDHGLTVRVDIAVTAFEGNGRVQQAHLSDGSVVACDIVVIGKGVLPAVDFVPRDQIDTDLGIRVDAHLRTSADSIYAAGDVAQGVDIARQTGWVNAIWPEAVIQGRLAGLNMAGRPVAYEGSLGRNVIRIFDLDVMTAGLPAPPADAGYVTASRTDARTGTYRKLVFKNDILVGMTQINDIEQGGLLVSLIRNRASIRLPPEALLDPAFNFRKLMINLR